MQPVSSFSRFQRLSTDMPVHTVPSSRPRPAAHAARLAMKCSSQRSDGGPGPQSVKAAPECASEYPNESLKLNAEDGLFPRRQPGEFPAVSVQPGLRQRLANAVSSLTGAAAAPVEASAAVPATTEEAAEYDPLRDGPLRYCGYANECGEAFAAWLPFWGVPFSYAVAITYVLVDTVDKYSRARREARAELDSTKLDPAVNEDRLVGFLAAERAMDTVVWQMLASVAIPGYTIHTIVAVAHSLLLQAEGTEQLQSVLTQAAPTFGTSYDVLLALFDKSMPTMIGLAAIPFIVHPIDESVHAVMNVSLRPAVKKFLCNQGQGNLAGLAICTDCNKEQCEVEE